MTGPVHVGRLVPDLIERVAGTFSGRAAVITSESTVTYVVLFDRARRIAGALREHGVRPGDIVALCTRRDPDYVASALAVWFAGGAFMPLDPAHPWTVQELVALTGMSRTTFAERFRARAGETPIAYFTRWRMMLAGIRQARPVRDADRRLPWIVNSTAAISILPRIRGVWPRGRGRRAFGSGCAVARR